MRPLRPADVPALAAMLSSMEPWLTHRVTAQQWEVTLRAIPPEELAFVVEDEQGLAGYVQFRLGGTFAWAGYVRVLAVHPGRRGQGLGRKIMAFAEDMILARGANVFLLCSAFNQKAREFYQALGYREVGRLPDFLTAGTEEVIYRKTTGPIRR
jgi:ribosomal protein S18 acetylase RimI-like enzyme